VPTFTIFGPQLPEWFAPLHPEAEWIEAGRVPTSRARIIAGFRRHTAFGTLARKKFARALKNLPPGICPVGCEKRDHHPQWDLTPGSGLFLVVVRTRRQPDAN